jgi:hypothetical protein
MWVVMNAPKRTPSLAVEQALLKRRQYPIVATTSLSGWERETGRGIWHEFGEYRLTIQTNQSRVSEEVVIQEDCSSIATRVWDCAVVTTKWLEAQALKTTQNSETSPNLHDALHLRSPDASPSSSSQHPIQVLELGSGMGLLSICLAKMGAAVMSTEYGSAVAHLQRNCERNHVAMACPLEPSFSNCAATSTLQAGRVLCRELNWYKTTETLQSLFPKSDDVAQFDVIVVTDCSLSIKDSMGVLDMIQKYGTPGHTTALVGLCLEREGTPYFIECATRLFPHVTVVPKTEFHEHYLTSRHTILLIQL